MKRIALLIILFTFFSCSHRDIKVAQNKLDSHPVGNLAYWSWVKEYNLETKVTTKLKDEITDYLNLWKKVYGLESNSDYYPTQIEPENFEHVFRYAVLSFPREYKIRINKHVKSIFLVRNLGISTLAVQLKSFDKVDSSQFIVFMDIDVLNQKINDWYKWREETAFKKTSNLQLSPNLSNENSVVDTIQYSLAQLYGIILNWNPKYYPTSNMELLTNFKKYELLNQSWKLENDIVSSKFDSIPEDMNYLRYYSKDDRLFNLDEMLVFSKALKSTNYPNLYAFSSSSKDFVESIASYIHTNILKRPFNIDIKNETEIVGNYKSCWKQPRCLKKKIEIEKILNLEKSP